MDRTTGRSGGRRIIALSALSGFIAPLVFVGIIVLRKVERRLNVQYRHWSKRLRARDRPLELTSRLGAGSIAADRRGDLR